MLNVSFEEKSGVKVEFKVQTKKAIIVDESASGKTLIFKLMMKRFGYTKEKKIVYVTRQTEESLYGYVESSIKNSNYIIILDDADSYIEKYEKLIYSDISADMIIVLKNFGMIKYRKDMKVGYMVKNSKAIYFKEGIYDSNF